MLKAFLNQNKLWILLGFGVLIFVVLRIPTFWEPHYYVDEGMYGSAGSMIRQGRVFYKEIYDHKLPGMFYFYALFGTSHQLLVAKIVSMLLGIVSMAGVYKLMKSLFSTKHAVVAFYSVGILLGLPILEGNIANAELFFIPFIIWGTYFGIKKNLWKVFLAGALFGISFLIKFHPITNFLMVAFFIFVTTLKKDANNSVIPAPVLRSVTVKDVKAGIYRYLQSVFSPKLIKLFLGLLTPLLLWSLFEASRGNFGSFIQVAFVDAFGYAGAKIVYQNWFLNLITYGEARIVMAFVATMYSTYLFWSGKISRSIFIITLMLIADIFSAFLSGRRYRHYLLTTLVSFSYFVAVFVGRMKSKELIKDKLIALIKLLSIAFGVSAYYVFGMSWGYNEITFPQEFHSEYHYRDVRSMIENNTLGYYGNFLIHAKQGTLTDKSYKGTFSTAELRLDALKLHTDEYDNGEVYVYTDDGWAYAYINKYSPTKMFVAFQLFYEGNDKYKDQVIGELEQSGVVYIAVDKRRNPYDELVEYMDTNFFLAEEGEYFDYYVRVD